MYILFLVLLSSSLVCRFLLFPKSHHNNINNIELTTCNNDKAATASQLLYCNSATVVIGVISINTKKVTKTNVIISVGYFRYSKKYMDKIQKTEITMKLLMSPYKL